MSGKRFTEAAAGFDREAEHSPAEAIRILKAWPAAKFDETVEVAFRLGIAFRILNASAGVCSASRSNAATACS